MVKKFDANDYIGVNSDKTSGLFSDVCFAETELLEACAKLPRYGKKCNCKEETIGYKFSVCLKANERPRQRCLECGGYDIMEEPEFKGEKFVVRMIGENRITIPEVYAETLKLNKGEMVRVTIERVK